MSKIIIVLMVISAAISAYARGRREGTWSWPLFVKTLLALWLLCAVVALFSIWLGRLMGPEHALPATLLIVVVIVAGVTALALWLKPRRGKR
jgi:O-antigen/teichoic acid export membrane protein